MTYVIRLVALAGAGYMARWAYLRLECLFFSAFEYAQAAMLHRCLAFPLRILGVHQWTYKCFFSMWHRTLLAVYYLSALWMPLQLIRGDFVLVLDAGYLLASAAVLAVWYTGCVRCKDGHKHISYNSFAPLREAQRRELSRQRNLLQLTAVFLRLDLGEKTPAADLAAEEYERTAKRFQRL